MLITLAAEVSIHITSLLIIHSFTKVYCNLLLVKIRILSNPYRTTLELYRLGAQQRSHRGRVHDYRLLCPRSDYIWSRLFLPVVLA